MGIFNAGAGVGKLIMALSDRDNQEKASFHQLLRILLSIGANSCSEITGKESRMKANG
jgi:hypothetical protein